MPERQPPFDPSPRHGAALPGPVAEPPRGEWLHLTIGAATDNPTAVYVRPDYIVSIHVVGGHAQLSLLGGFTLAVDESAPAILAQLLDSRPLAKEAATRAEIP